MKRFLTSALVLSSFSLFALVGCEDTSKTSVEVKTKGPEGTTVEKDTKEIKSTGTPTETPKDPVAPTPEAPK